MSPDDNDKNVAEVLTTSKTEAELQDEAIKLLREMKLKNKLPIQFIKSRGFYTRHIRSRDERKAHRKAQKQARKNNR